MSPASTSRFVQLSRWLGLTLVALLFLQLLAVLAVLVLRLSLPDLAWPPLLATALEQWSVFGVDNLTVPVLTGVLWQHWSA